MREFRNGITYTQIITFKAIVEAGNISKAAKLLGISSASVSYSLKSLEQLLQQSLFNRNTRSMKLTDVGEQLYQMTSSSVEQLTSSIDTLCDASDKPTGTLRLNMALNIYQVFLKPLLTEFQSLYPEVELDISLSDTLDKSTDQQIDIGFRFGEKVSENMVARALNPYFPPVKVALFASAKYLENYGVPSDINGLAGHRVIRFRAPTSGQIMPLQLKQKVGDHSEVVAPENLVDAMVVNSVEVMIDMVEQGLAMGFAMDASVAEQLESQQLFPVLQELWCDIPNVYMYYSVQNRQVLRVRCFLDFMAKKLGYF